MAEQAEQAISSSPAAPGALPSLPLAGAQRNRLLAIAGGAVLVLIVAVWFFVTLGKRKEAYAAEALEKATVVAENNDLGAAASQFEAIIRDFRGTAAASEASIRLAQVRLIAEQDAGAITTLTTFLGENPPASFAAPANGLLGTAYENTGKLDEAAAAYLKASELATVDYLKAGALLDAARVKRNAGKKDEAIKLLKDLVEKYKEATIVTEAQLMLGEMTLGQTGG